MFKVIGKHVPPPAIFPSPLLWGDPEKVRERFGVGVRDLRTTPYLYSFDYPFPPAEVVDFFITYYGPTLRAYHSLNDEAKAAFKDGLTKLWEASNQATDGTTTVKSEYLEVVGTRT